MSKAAPKVNVKEKSEAVSGRRRNNIMAKRKRTKAQTMIYNTLHRKLTIEKHEHHKHFVRLKTRLFKNMFQTMTYYFVIVGNRLHV